MDTSYDSPVVRPSTAVSWPQPRHSYLRCLNPGRLCAQRHEKWMVQGTWFRHREEHFNNVQQLGTSSITWDKMGYYTGRTVWPTIRYTVILILYKILYTYCQVILVHIPEKSIATLGTVPVLSRSRRCNFSGPNHVQATNISNKTNVCLNKLGIPSWKRVFDRQKSGASNELVKHKRGQQ